MSGFGDELDIRETKPGIFKTPGGSDCYSPAEAVYDSWGWCGCGRPEEAQALVLDILKAQDRCRDVDAKDHIEELKSIVSKDPDLTATVLLYVLDRLELLEHGSNIMWSWLTPRGKQAMKILEEEEA